jgi:hypothetical protein
MEGYNGWKNYETWNVALWLQNDYPLYCITRGFKGYATPFLSLRHELAVSLGYAQTKDGVNLWDMSLDVAALDSMIQEA